MRQRDATRTRASPTTTGLRPSFFFLTGINRDRRRRSRAWALRRSAAMSEIKAVSASRAGALESNGSSSSSVQPEGPGAARGRPADE